MHWGRSKEASWEDRLEMMMAQIRIIAVGFLRNGRILIFNIVTRLADGLDVQYKRK